MLNQPLDNASHLNAAAVVDDGYEVGFAGFAGVVDAVGGIQMCPEKAIKDPQSNLDIPAGCQQMDGATALGYVRMRKQDPRGDLGRAERQREMVGALAKKTLSPMTGLFAGIRTPEKASTILLTLLSFSSSTRISASA